MSQPPGFEDPAHPDWVCKVCRAIYGLKQSPRQWNVELNSALLSLGLTRLAYNPSLYFKLVNGSLVGALTAHVDDLAVSPEWSLSANNTISTPLRRHSFLPVAPPPPLPLTHPSIHWSSENLVCLLPHPSTTNSLGLSYGYPNVRNLTSPLPPTNFCNFSKTPPWITGTPPFVSCAIS